MAKKRPTPEEQLLDLIEKGERAGSTAGLKRKKTVFPKRLLLSLNSGVIRAAKKLTAGLKKSDIKTANRIFLIIALGLIAYSITDFMFRRPDLAAVYDKARQAVKKADKTEIKMLVEQLPFLHYFEMVRRRNIFSPVVVKKPAPKPEVKKVTLVELAKDLNLVGISWGKEPVAMIEDKAVEKTYFLKKGSSINQFKIDDILKDKIILSFEDETLELM
ncbi:MAG: hypothetical protein U9Q08_03155 [Candidatus Omnitrophota bacterium]|nr:hypothetical protein [Candidatus Omnitrophota bacterium]